MFGGRGSEGVRKDLSVAVVFLWAAWAPQGVPGGGSLGGAVPCSQVGPAAIVGAELARLPGKVPWRAGFVGSVAVSAPLTCRS